MKLINKNQYIIAIALLILIGIVMYFWIKSIQNGPIDTDILIENINLDISSGTFSDLLGPNQSFTITPPNINDFLESPTQLVEFPIELFYATNSNLTFVCNIVSVDSINSTINFKFFGNYQSIFFNIYYNYSFNNPSSSITLFPNPSLSITLSNFDIYAPVFQQMTKYISSSCANVSEGGSCIPQQSVCISGECTNCLINNNWVIPECSDMLKDLCVGELKFCDNPSLICGPLESSSDCAELVTQCQTETQSYFQKFGISCSI